MITENFLLESEAAVELYHRHAAKMPIIDYHNHLDPKKIAEDYRFESITELWLGGDHYKWRALRVNGIEERYITGDGDPFTKFMKWAETVPYTMRNPLYHWTHLELERYFGISELLNKKSGERIYRTCNDRLKEEGFSVRGLLRRMNVEVLCTTDDPADDLGYHKKLAIEDFEIKVLPTWRPDKVMAVEDVVSYNLYMTVLGEAADVDIAHFNDLLVALGRRQAYFADHGCRISDHGLYAFPGKHFTDDMLEKLFAQIRKGNELTEEEVEIFKSGMLYHLAVMNHERGWVQQFHVGAIRNNNQRLFRQLGADIGCDSMADRPVAEALSKFFGRLDREGMLAKTILYNLNPKDTEVMVSMAYNYNDGSVAGKMQYGAAWWFLDQMDGMIRQMNALSAGGLLSHFVGMLTDSRSFLSFPRHEYFRRILCNLWGNDLESGKLPTGEMPFIGGLIENISYNNAKNYLRL